MSRPSVIFALLLTPGLLLAAGGDAPHLDPDLLPAGCASCHEGHGVSRSPMLPAPQREVCLGCHDSGTHAESRPTSGLLSRGGPSSDGFSFPYPHPVSESAFSESEPGSVTCTSCHSPHRGLPEDRNDPRAVGEPYRSTRNPREYEWELCESCHGSRDRRTGDHRDPGRLLSPDNRSFHPVEAPGLGTSPSVVPELRGGQINCTDCHGNSVRGGLRGPHGSAVPHILRFPYKTTDGGPENLEAYALCYQCHDRATLLARSLFGEHRRHVELARASCATCHDPHGSVRNRGLIRFGGSARASGVSPSASGRLEFLSELPGQGQCYLTCHGINHDPLGYGGASLEELPRGGRKSLLGGSGAGSRPRSRVRDEPR